MPKQTLLILCSILFAASTIASAAPPAEYRFAHHYIDIDLPGTNYGLTDCADIGHDGHPAFLTGGHDKDKDIFWFEYQGPDKWVRHLLGTNQPSDVGGKALDVDGDGWIDFVAGGAWYRNTGKPKEEQFERIVFDKDLIAVHDLVIADIDGDGRPDVVTMSDKQTLRWYSIRKNPRDPWIRHDIGPGVHAGVAVGDINGDGHLDVVRSNVWYENADGKGTKWIEHPIPFGNSNNPYPLATRCVVADINKDGHNDLVMTENEIRGGKIAWLENMDGKGLKWKVHPLPAGDHDARSLSFAGRRRFQQDRQARRLHGRDGSRARRSPAALVHLGKCQRQGREFRRARDSRPRSRRA